MCSQVLGLTGSPGGDNSLVQLLLLHLHLLVICACHDCLSARTIPNGGPLHGHLRRLLWNHATIGDCNCVNELFLTAASEVIESLATDAYSSMYWIQRMRSCLCDYNCISAVDVQSIALCCKESTDCLQCVCRQQPWINRNVCVGTCGQSSWLCHLILMRLGR